MEFTLLGSVQALPDGGGPDLLAKLRPQHRLLLVILLFAKGNRVSMEQLTRLVWDGTPPSSNPQGDLNGLASDLRRALGGEQRIPRGSDGYRVNAEGQEVDAFRFQDLARQARGQAHRDDEAVRLGRLALGQWGPRRQGLRGPEPLAGLRGRWAEDRREHLRSEHRNALICMLDAEVRRGNHEQVTAELDALEADGIDRTDEDFARIYLLACQQAGHRTQAADFYRRYEHAAHRNNTPISEGLSRLTTHIGHQTPTVYLNDTITGETISLPRRELAMTEQEPGPEKESIRGEGDQDSTEESSEAKTEQESATQPRDPGLIQNFGLVIAPNGNFGIIR